METMKITGADFQEEVSEVRLQPLLLTIGEYP